MGERGAARLRPSWTRWAALSDVQRVERYTRQSMVGLTVLACGALAAGTASQLGDAGAAVGLAAFSVLLGTAGSASVLEMLRSERRGSAPWRWLAAGGASVVAAFVVAGLLSWPVTVAGTLVVELVIVTSIVLGLVRDRRVSVLTVLGAFVVSALVAGPPSDVFAASLFAAASVLSAQASLWLLDIVRELEQARRAQGELAVAEERLRFSRDLHDVLGQRLATIAVQAELAATLSARGDDRAGDRMLEVREVAHEALREAREIARGYRPVDVDRELEGARSLLRSAEIELQVDIEPIPRGWHEAAGWIVREAVTNVLRHSDAGRVSIACTSGTLRITNDGAARTRARTAAACGRCGSDSRRSAPTCGRRGTARSGRSRRACPAAGR